MDPFTAEQPGPGSALEYLIDLGVKGNHLLFDTTRIREAFSRQHEALAGMGSHRIGEVQQAIRRILSIPDFEGKKEFIAALPREVQDILIFLYFQMIERNLALSQPPRH